MPFRCHVCAAMSRRNVFENSKQAKADVTQPLPEDRVALLRALDALRSCLRDNVQVNTAGRHARAVEAAVRGRG